MRAVRHLGRVVSFVVAFIILLLLAFYFEFSGIEHKILTLLVSDTSILVVIFSTVLGMVLVFNLVFTLISKTPYRPFGEGLSFDKFMGAIGGIIFNTIAFGFFTYDSFYTAVTTLSVEYQGKLDSLLPPLSIESVSVIMVGLLVFSAYTLVVTFLSVLGSPFLRKSGKPTPA